MPNFTVNYGLRFDHFTAYTSASQVSPRLNCVWQALPDTTVHAGYSRYLSPPPFELVGGKDIAMFANTTSPPLDHAATPPLAERANYYDVGVQQKFTPGFTIGLDTYYKQSSNLIDEGQFGAPIILTPFNYRYGKQYGAEFTANYTTGASPPTSTSPCKAPRASRSTRRSSISRRRSRLHRAATTSISITSSSSPPRAASPICGATRDSARTSCWAPACARI